jgi:predicted kinase
MLQYAEYLAGGICFYITTDTHIHIHTLNLQAPFQTLSQKLMSLFRESFSNHTFPYITKKLAKFEPCTHNPAAQLLLKRGRR